MGKTAAGAVWLDAKMVSPYDYWQYWRNTADGDVEQFLKLFTELSLDEIARLTALKGQEINEAKKVLAAEATALLHGRAEAEKAAGTARTTFRGRRIRRVRGFYVLIGLALAGAAVAAVFIESKPKPDAAPTAMPLEAELGLQEAA